MPWYELFCLARPQLPKPTQAELLKAAAKVVQEGGGVLRSFKSFGDRPLAYAIRVPGNKFVEAFMWQLSFISPPSVLSDLRQNLSIDERVLRHILIKTDPHRPGPTTSAVKRQAAALMSDATEPAAPPTAPQ